MTSKGKRALIIRSASFQQLDQNLPSIQQQMPDYTFDLLTHEHGVKLAEKYEGISQVIAYPYKKSFNRKFKIKELPFKSYDTVIFMVANITGVGFGNVLQFAFTIPADNYLQCNMHAKLSTINKKQYRVDLLIRVVQKSISFVVAGICSIVVVPYLIYKLFRIKAKSSEE